MFSKAVEFSNLVPLDDSEIAQVEASLDTLFNRLLKTPGSYKISIQIGIDYPPINLEVFVNNLKTCDKLQVHISRARAHILKLCAREITFVVYLRRSQIYFELCVFDSDVDEVDDIDCINDAMSIWKPKNMHIYNRFIDGERICECGCQMVWTGWE
jgi:hypothetical protein